MFFRNITFYRFPMPLSRHMRELAEGRADADEQLPGLLAEAALRPVGAVELMSRGFVPPLGEDGALCHVVLPAVWVTLGGEDRILPAAAVNRELQQRLDRIEKSEGRRPGGRARKRIKEDVVAELLPRAFVKPYRLDAYMDFERGLLAIDTSSRKAAESLAAELRFALGSFPALPLHAETAARAVLTHWVAAQETGVPGLVLGDEAELRDPVAGGAVVKLSRQELQAHEVEQHLEAGKQVVRLGLVFEDRVAFTLGEDLVLRKVKFLDGAVDSLGDQENEDLAAELNARFALMVGEVGRLFDRLAEALDFSQAEQ